MRGRPPPPPPRGREGFHPWTILSSPAIQHARGGGKSFKIPCRRIFVQSREGNTQPGMSSTRVQGQIRRPSTCSSVFDTSTRHSCRQHGWTLPELSEIPVLCSKQKNSDEVLETQPLLVPGLGVLVFWFFIVFFLMPSSLRSHIFCALFRVLRHWAARTLRKRRRGTLGVLRIRHAVDTFMPRPSGRLLITSGLGSLASGL